MIWLKAIPIRFWIYGAIVAAFGYLIWKDHYNVKRLNKARVELKQANANLAAERINTEKANASANRYAKRITQLRGPRSPAPVLMCKLPRVLPAASISARGTDDTPAQHDVGVFEDVDIGPRIDVPFRACEENLIKLEELQRWVRER